MCITTINPGFSRATEHFKIDRDYTNQVTTSSLKDLRLGSPVYKEVF